jgi:hypothetical protein
MRRKKPRLSGASNFFQPVDVGRWIRQLDEAQIAAEMCKPDGLSSSAPASVALPLM